MHEDEESFEVDPKLKRVLLESIAQCEREETISAERLFEEMPFPTPLKPSAKPA